jgi:Bifunctional DNA primase/polymerase, N-terminal
VISLPRAASWYALYGWRVFPCLPGRKEPAIKGWQVAATRDLEQVGQWWRSRPDCNIGLACGPDSGLYVLDVDQHETDGEASLTRAARRLGELPQSLAQRTGGGGRQLLFRYPDGHDCRNTAGARRGLGPGLDTRGQGGFVVAPPSLHPSGARYRWLLGPHQAALADLPPRWIARLERHDEPTILVPRPQLASMARVAIVIIERRIDMVIRAGKGSRNDELYRSSFYLAKLALSGTVEWPAARDAMLAAAHSAGLDPREAAKTVTSAALGAGLAP